MREHPLRVFPLTEQRRLPPPVLVPLPWVVGGVAGDNPVQYADDAVEEARQQSTAVAMPLVDDRAECPLGNGQMFPRAHHQRSHQRLVRWQRRSHPRRGVRGEFQQPLVRLSPSSSPTVFPFRPPHSGGRKEESQLMCQRAVSRTDMRGVEHCAK